MPTPRHQLVSLKDTPWYHCVSRCVRRAWLCGVDPYDGMDYSHRRQWIVDRLELLVSVFAIEVAAYAVMSNHSHVVLRVDTDKAAAWDMIEIIERWHRLCHGDLLSKRFAKGETLDEAEMLVLCREVEKWRERFQSISWFMKFLNENIAKRANIEDGVTGKYWETRFKSQALLDEQAVLSCMAYCDLNPIRAQLAETPETSDYTSIQKRIIAAKVGAIPEKLTRFNSNEKSTFSDGIPCTLKDYIELVDQTGRCIREDKNGYITETLSPILQRLNIAPEIWVDIATTFEDSCGPWVGKTTCITQACENTGRKWICSTEGNRKLYPT